MITSSARRTRAATSPTSRRTCTSASSRRERNVTLTTDEAALMAAVVRNPGAEVPLLMLADCCEEQGEGRAPLAAGFRALAELAKSPAVKRRRYGVDATWYDDVAFNSKISEDNLPSVWLKAIEGGRC